jgi:transcriptional regulator with XRE-family HTH domain
MAARKARPGALRLRRALEESGKTQQDVADALGVTRQAVSLWLQGGLIAPDLRHAHQLEKLFGVPTEDWL